MLDELLTKSDIPWEIPQHIARRYLYHATRLHASKEQKIKESIDDADFAGAELLKKADGIDLVSQASIYYFLKFGNPQEVIDFGIYNPTEKTYRPFVIPQLDFIKTDYTFGEYINLTPITKKLTNNSDFLKPQQYPKLETTLTFINEKKARIIAFLDKHGEHFPDTQTFMTSSFQFYEYIWWNIRNGNVVAERDYEEKVSELITPDFDYD